MPLNESRVKMSTGVVSSFSDGGSFLLVLDEPL